MYKVRGTDHTEKTVMYKKGMLVLEDHYGTCICHWIKLEEIVQKGYIPQIVNEKRKR